MRALRLTLLTMALLVICAGPAVAAAALTEGGLSYERNGLVTEIQGVLSEPVRGSDMTFVVLDEEQAQNLGKEPTLLLFDGQGQSLGELTAGAGFEPEQVSDLFLSPQRDLLAVDSGTWIIRAWSFLAFPSLEPLERDAVYLASEEIEGFGESADLVWAGRGRVLYTAVDGQEAASGEEARRCDYDACGPRSVMLYDVRKDEIVPLFAGSALCDYTLLGLDTGSGPAQVRAVERCAPELNGWTSYESMMALPARHVTIALPK